MSFFITKTLLKEFLQCPKLAWRHVNRKDIYQYIQQNTYPTEGVNMGQTVEELFLQRYPHLTRIVDTFDTTSTQQALSRGDDIIYQPVFQFQNKLYVRPDLLIKNLDGSYDCIEIKSKTSVLEKDSGRLLSELLHDLSFQSYVLYKSIPHLYSGRMYLVYLNKDFIKQGTVNGDGLFLEYMLSGQDMLGFDFFDPLLDRIYNALCLSESEFDALYPYDGYDPLVYFGRSMPRDSIFSIKSWHTIRSQIKDWYLQGKQSVFDISTDEVYSLHTNPTTSRIAKYIDWMQHEKVYIDVATLQKILGNLRYPLCFYDYETIATPIPLFDGYRPWQNVVVQYSMHILHADGSINHTYGIISAGATTNREVIDSFVRAISGEDGTYIVRNKSFENARNLELCHFFPEYASILLHINHNTFDLMEIFKNDVYFDPHFGGSCSLKAVVPVLTDMDYTNLAVCNGAQASYLLYQLVQGSVDSSLANRITQDLISYCSYDSLAMLKIFTVLQSIAESG